MSLITLSDIGKIVIIAKRLAVLSDDRYGTRGQVALCPQLDDYGRPQCYGLVWEWGGDWDGFGDGAQRDSETLHGWEPDAIDEAISAALALLPHNEQMVRDLDWYRDWAREARKTMDDDRWERLHEQ